MKKSSIALLISIVCSVSSIQAEQADIESAKDQVSYSLGMIIGERVIKSYSDLNYEQLFAGIKAQHTGQKTAMTMEQATQTLASYKKTISDKKSAGPKAAGEKYRAKNAKREGVKTSKSGLQYEILTAADGPKPKASDTVTVHYKGTLINGDEFDSSYKRGVPASFSVNRVIRGWTEGLQLMNVGSKYRFVIPSDLAYGDRGTGRDIGPGETLIFEVELIAIK